MYKQHTVLQMSGLRRKKKCVKRYIIIIISFVKKIKNKTYK